MPKVVTTIRELRAACDDARRRGEIVGVVPTMGYLHEGHRELIRTACRECGFVVVTIFVNPLQFGPTEDLDRYPRDLDGDFAAVAAEGADVVFAPRTSELYPQYPPATTVHVVGLTDALCGASRPGHFDGVTTVVTKLLDIVGPGRASFGRKDAQQLAVIIRLVADLDLPVTVVGCPLVREADGLARSSRNAYLEDDQRAAAAQIFAALRAGVDAVRAGERSARVIESLVRERIEAEPLLRVDYVESRDAATIAVIDTISDDVLLAVAVFCGATRLIDNVGLQVHGANVDADLGIGWSPERAYPVG
jgi:pantoate--beta-alanine ligase